MKMHLFYSLNSNIFPHWCEKVANFSSSINLLLTTKGVICLSFSCGPLPIKAPQTCRRKKHTPLFSGIIQHQTLTRNICLPPKIQVTSSTYLDQDLVVYGFSFFLFYEEPKVIFLIWDNPLKSSIICVIWCIICNSIIICIILKMKWNGGEVKRKREMDLTNMYYIGFLSLSLSSRWKDKEFLDLENKWKKSYILCNFSSHVKTPCTLSDKY